jgi:hypothetical protein
MSDMIKIFERYRTAQLRDLQRRKCERAFDKSIPPLVESRPDRSGELQTECVINMTNQVTKTNLPPVDGFAGYEDRVEGDDEQQTGGVIHGALLKFANEATWVTRDGDELPPDLELVAVDVGRVVQKWIDQRPVETIVLEPHQKFPDVQELNEKTPRDEWSEGPDGQPRGPWQSQHITYLLNIETMDRYSFPTGTVGGSIAVRELVDRTKWTRKFRGSNLYPVVTLGDVHMNTRFGGRQRPCFVIKRWVNLGADDKALPAPTENTPTQPARVESGARTIEEPSLREQMNDDLPF